MLRSSEFIANSVLNSLWIIAAVWAIAALGTYLLKNSAASYRHCLWINALVMCIATPILSSTQVWSKIPANFAPPSAQLNRTKLSTPQAPGDVDDVTPLNHTQTLNRRVVDTSGTNLQLITILYCAFNLVCVIRFVRLWRQKERLQKSSTLVSDERLERVLKHCREAFQVRDVNIACSTLARVPCATGVRNPLIILPVAFCETADEDVLLSVIGHEMAHISRHDYLVKLLIEIVSLPLSFHPLVFLMKREIERERELACDELITTRVLRPESYARSLLQAADLTLLPASQSAIQLSIFDGKILEKRIMRLTKDRTRMSLHASRLLLAIFLLVLCTSMVGLSAFAVELRTEVAAGLSETVPVVMPTIATSEPVRMPQQIEKSLSGTEANDANQRAQAACAAGEKRDLEAIPTLIGMLGDDTKIQPVSCWNSGPWNPALDTFRAPSPGEQAALALASMGRPAFTPLVNQLDSSNSVTRRNAAWAIGELTNMLPGARATSVPQLISLLGDSDVWVRMAAARAIGELRDERATETLIVALADNDWRLRQMATWALSEMKDDRAVAALCNVLLADSKPEVRLGAAEALGEIRSESALASLKQALNDSESSVSDKVKWAIEEIEGS